MSQIGYYFGSVLIGVALIYGLIVVVQTIQGKRSKAYSSQKLREYLMGFMALLPALLGVWLIPFATNNAEFLPLSSPEYYKIDPVTGFAMLSIVIFYAITQFSVFFPHKNRYTNIIPSLLILTTLPGLASSSLIIIINQFVTGAGHVSYLFLLFVVSSYILVLTSRISGRKVAVLGNMVAHDLNMKIFNNIFKFSYRKYEKVASGKLYTILNDDIGTLFFFSQMLPGLYSSIITMIVVSVYLWTISFIGSMLLLGISAFIMVFQNFFTGSMTEAWNKARDTRESFTDVITGLVNGFKELIVHNVKRKEYLVDLEEGSEVFYTAHREAMYVDIDKTIYANLAFTFAIGTSCLIFPIVLNLEKELITTFVITMLYLWGPMSGIIGAIPNIMRVQVSRGRINEFLENMDSASLSYQDNSAVASTEIVHKVEAMDVCFTYDEEDEEVSMIGPVNMEANNGEVTFIIGGNGSGKTTFLKVLIGLYKAFQGKIVVNGKPIEQLNLGEYFSVIYSDFYLYKKIYGIKPEKLSQVNEWIKVLGLEGKVTIEDGAFSTIDLSKGQRKRLSILRSYLEDRPIIIYDECAADLDPEFKEFFYNVLLQQMKKEDKVVIIISHDDGYFSVADRIYKMEMGKSRLIKGNDIHKDIFESTQDKEYASNGVVV